MAKRGWKYSHRVRFLWVDSGIKGSKAFMDYDAADFYRAQLQRNSVNNGSAIEITIEEIS